MKPAQLMGFAVTDTGQVQLGIQNGRMTVEARALQLAPAGKDAVAVRITAAAAGKAGRDGKRVSRGTYCVASVAQAKALEEVVAGLTGKSPTKEAVQYIYWKRGTFALNNGKGEMDQVSGDVSPCGGYGIAKVYLERDADCSPPPKVLTHIQTGLYVMSKATVEGAFKAIGKPAPTATEVRAIFQRAAASLARELPEFATLSKEAMSTEITRRALDIMSKAVAE